MAHFDPFSLLPSPTRDNPNLLKEVRTNLLLCIRVLLLLDHQKWRSLWQTHTLALINLISYQMLTLLIIFLFFRLLLMKRFKLDGGRARLGLYHYHVLVYLCLLLLLWFYSFSLFVTLFRGNRGNWLSVKVANSFLVEFWDSGIFLCVTNLNFPFLFNPTHHHLLPDFRRLVLLNIHLHKSIDYALTNIRRLSFLVVAVIS